MDGPIALTGATGFIGGAIAQHCQKTASPFTALIRDSASAQQLLKTGAQTVVGDLDNQGALSRLCEDASVLIHCAAFMGKSEGEKSDRVNVEGTRNAVLASQQQNCPLFVYISSISVYRGTDHPARVFTEEIEPVMAPGLNHYSRSKLEGEYVVRELCEQGNQNYLIIRPTNVYGPGCRPWGSDVEKFVKRFHFTFGNIPFNFVHIEDLVQGIFQAIATPSAHNQAYNLGAEMIRLRDFYKYIADTVGTSTFHLPAPIDATIRHGVDLYARLRKQVRSTGYSMPSHYPHEKATQAFGYSPSHWIQAQE